MLSFKKKHYTQAVDAVVKQGYYGADVECMYTTKEGGHCVVGWFYEFIFGHSPDYEDALELVDVDAEEYWDEWILKCTDPAVTPNADDHDLLKDIQVIHDTEYALGRPLEYFKDSAYKLIEQAFEKEAQEERELEAA